MQTDRRRFRRYQLELAVRFRFFLPSRPDVSSSFQSAQIYDLSQSGVRLLTNVVQSGNLHIFHPDPATSEQCHLEIEIPDEGKVLTMKGKVVWYDKSPEEAAYTFQLGIQFVDVPPEDRKRIQALIKRLSTATSGSTSSTNDPADGGGAMPERAPG